MTSRVRYQQGGLALSPQIGLPGQRGSQAGHHSWLDLRWAAPVTHHHKITLWGQQQEHWTSVGFMLLAKVLGNFKSKCMHGNNFKAVCELPYCPISDRWLEASPQLSAGHGPAAAPGDKWHHDHPSARTQGQQGPLPQHHPLTRERSMHCSSSWGEKKAGCLTRFISRFMFCKEHSPDCWGRHRDTYVWPKSDRARPASAPDNFPCNSTWNTSGILLATIFEPDEECYSCSGGASLSVCRKKYVRILPASQIAARWPKITYCAVSLPLATTRNKQPNMQNSSALCKATDRFSMWNHPSHVTALGRGQATLLLQINSRGYLRKMTQVVP